MHRSRLTKIALVLILLAIPAGLVANPDDPEVPKDALRELKGKVKAALKEYRAERKDAWDVFSDAQDDFEHEYFDQKLPVRGVVLRYGIAFAMLAERRGKAREKLDETLRECLGDAYAEYLDEDPRAVKGNLDLLVEKLLAKAEAKDRKTDAKEHGRVVRGWARVEKKGFEDGTPLSMEFRVPSEELRPGTYSRVIRLPTTPEGFDPVLELDPVEGARLDLSFASHDGEVYAIAFSAGSGYTVDVEDGKKKETTGLAPDENGLTVVTGEEFDTSYLAFTVRSADGRAVDRVVHRVPCATYAEPDPDPDPDPDTDVTGEVQFLFGDTGVPFGTTSTAASFALRNAGVATTSGEVRAVFVADVVFGPLLVAIPGSDPEGNPGIFSSTVSVELGDLSPGTYTLLLYFAGQLVGTDSIEIRPPE